MKGVALLTIGHTPFVAVLLPCLLVISRFSQQRQLAINNKAESRNHQDVVSHADPTINWNRQSMIPKIIFAIASCTIQLRLYYNNSYSDVYSLINQTLCFPK